MDGIKYIGMDIHKEAISIAVMNGAGKLVMESIVETKAITILQFIRGLRGDLHVTFEEGTWAAWLYDLLKPHVTKVVVCDPRKNVLLKRGTRATRLMRESWPICCAADFCDRSTTERMAFARSKSCRVVISRSAKISRGS